MAHKWTGLLCGAIAIVGWCLASAASLSAQEAMLEFPIRPFNVDVMLRQQTFAPDDREIGVQLGITALRYGNVEVRTIYQYFSIHSQEFRTDQHSLFLNPRWNNFIDILDFPIHKPISRLLRHILFGPLEDRAVPYVGLLAGGVLPGPGNHAPGHLIGGQLGVRFPVARSLSVDISVQYSQYGVDFRGEAGQAQQWVFLTGVRF
ncbi:MAG: hypothetical protein E8D43_01775 [Nitrospira sp.]|nr:MAG: hypothetical protein E8D43_01775 [Nitrospira sp.]